MTMREARNSVVAGAAVTAVLVVWLAVIYGLNVGREWLAGEPEPEAPGRVCERYDDGITGAPAGGRCYPLPGWHVESSPRDRKYDVYVHDDASEAQWRSDVATSMAWHFLSREQQTEILHGKATIEKFRTKDEIDRETIEPPD
jgi:hypothetical protein